MAADTLLVFGAQYDTEDNAVADYEAVKDFYVQSGLIDTYDAAVIAKHANGKVKVVKKHEQPTRAGAVGGLGIGLVGGALVALFPAIGLGGALVAGAAGGSALGAVAGHVAGGMSRADLKDLGRAPRRRTKRTGRRGSHRPGSPRRGGDHPGRQAREEAADGRHRGTRGRRRRRPDPIVAGNEQ